MFLAITLTMLARWMQASLFNPGGFQKEFHQLRIGHKVTLILISFMVLTSFGIIIPESWLVYFTLPLIFLELHWYMPFARSGNTLFWY